MDNHKTARYAIVRGVPGTYDNCIKPQNPDRIDVELAREQHRAYCLALQKMGLQMVKIDPEDDFPDCCFVEDTATIIGDTAVITRMGTPSRALETGAVKKTVANYKKVREIMPPACLDGGDVLKIDSKLFVGLSQRTNRQAIEQIKGFIPEGSDYEIIPVEISNTLHLKTTCTFLGKGCIVLSPGHFDDGVFSAYKKVLVPEEEAYCANCLAVNGKVLLPAGYPRTRELIENEGFETFTLDISEFRKGNGGLTCLSIVF